MRHKTHLQLTLPWPPPELSPNARVHWSKKAKATKTYRFESMVLARNAGVRHLACGDGEIEIRMDFYPPDRRRRDRDNIFASCKAALDGLADALGVDDHRFRPHPFLQSQTAPRGRIDIQVFPSSLEK